MIPPKEQVEHALYLGLLVYFVADYMGWEKLKDCGQLFAVFQLLVLCFYHGANIFG